MEGPRRALRRGHDQPPRQVRVRVKRASAATLTRATRVVPPASRASSTTAGARPTLWRRSTSCTAASGLSRAYRSRWTASCALITASGTGRVGGRAVRLGTVQERESVDRTARDLETWSVRSATGQSVEDGVGLPSDGLGRLNFDDGIITIEHVQLCAGRVQRLSRQRAGPSFCLLSLPSDILLTVLQQPSLGPRELRAGLCGSARDGARSGRVCISRTRSLASRRPSWPTSRPASTSAASVSPTKIPSR